MTKAINKMLAIVLSFAMVLTGFTFLGGAVEVNAADKPALIGISIDEDDAGSGASQPAANGVYAWFVMAAEDADFEDAEVTSEDFTLQVKSGDGDWVSDPDGTAIGFARGDNYNEGTVTAEVPDNEDTFAKQWRFVYAGGGAECPVITQAAAEATEYTVTFDAEPGTVDPAEMTTTGGKLASLPEPTPEDEDYVFGGWTMFVPGESETDDPVEVAVTTDTVFEEDTTVYAKWIYKYWTPEDFTYGDWEYTGSVMIDGMTLKEDVYGITGFSPEGAEKAAYNHDLFIPDCDPEGKPINGIKDNAFKEQGIKSVSIPEGVTKDDRGDFFIEASAFERNEITSLNVPEGVLSIGTYAFRYNSLESVTFPESLMVIEPGAFAFNSNLSKVSFPENSDGIGIGMQAFARDAINKIQLPKNTNQLNQYAFFGNPSIVEVYIDGKSADGSLIQENTSRSHKVIDGVLTNTATLDANGGIIEPAELSELSIEYGKLVLVDEEGNYFGLPVPFKEGNVFLGWFDAAEGGNPVYEDDVFAAEDVTLYAQWSDDEDLLEADEALYDSFDAAAEAEEALEAASAAAKTPGEAAVNAAVAAQQKAKAAAEKAQAALTAAEKALEAMEAAGKTEGDPEYDAANTLVANAESMIDYANDLLDQANSAVSKAQADKAAADSAAAEAARQGTPDPSLPKVTAKKGTAKKTSVTVKWKKLSKKNQKKAEKVEIWVCPDKNFAAANTKTKVVSKKKASAKVSGLSKKTTYYAKVRTIKTVNGVKYVGKWSKVKKIKTKK